MMKKTAFLTALVFISACSLAPDYTRPNFFPNSDVFSEGQYEGQWKVAQEEDPALVALQSESFDTVFKNACIATLIEEARKDNPGLAIMAARVAQARATANIAGSYMIPLLEGNAAATRQQPNATVRQAATLPPVENNYKAGLGLSYEVDFFGSVLSGKRAANFDTRSVELAYDSTVLSLSTDIAQLYFTLHGQDSEIDLLQKTLALRDESLRILKKRMDVGAVTELDVAQYVVELETTRGDLYALQGERERTSNALAILLGRPPVDIVIESDCVLPAAPPVIPAGLPSALLEARPDVYAAEQDLMAANARIGVSRAAFFPNIILTATGGFESGLLGSLFNWSSRSWTVGPIATIPIFAAGRAVYNNDRAWARYEEAVALYRQKILVAFREVEDSLSTLRMLSAQEEAQKTAQKAAETAARLAKARYDSGDIGYLESIVAERAALDVARAGIQLSTARFVETARLLRALGRSW